MATKAMLTKQRSATRDTRCRLCLKNIEITQTAGIDLLENQDINRLVLDVYRVEVLQTDEGPTKICVPCYILLVDHYKLRIRCLATRKNFRLNQVVLLSQINAFRDVSGQQPISQIGEGRQESVAAQEKATQTDASLSSGLGEEPTRNVSNDEVNAETTVTEEQSEAAVETPTILIDDESSDDSVVTIRSNSVTDLMNGVEKETPAVEILPPHTEENVPRTVDTGLMAKNTTMERNASAEVVKEATAAQKRLSFGIRIQHLLPVLVDCRKEPHYLEALWPVRVSLDSNDPAPLEYMCRTCNKTFKNTEYKTFEQHLRKGGCIPTCRYCKTDWSAEHSCTFLKKYSYLRPHISGSDKYCSNRDPDIEVISGNESGVVQFANEKPLNETDANDSMVNGSKTKSKSDKSSRKSRRSSSSRKKANRNDRSRSRRSSKAPSETRVVEEEKRDTSTGDNAVYLSSSEDEPILNISSTKRRKVSLNENNP